MGAKISADTVLGLELVRRGRSVAAAAAEAGIFRSTLYRAMKRRDAAMEKMKQELRGAKK